MAVQSCRVGYRNLPTQNVQASASAAPATEPATVVTTGSAPVVMPIASLTSSQMRAAMDHPTIDEYAEVMLAANGWGPFPPAEAFYDGSTYWMWRGNHRRAALLQAAGKAGAGFDLLVPVIVRPGTERDAKLEGLSDNAEHGLRRTVEDKRKAVDWALSDPELSQWSNAKIGQNAGSQRRLSVSGERSCNGLLPWPTRSVLHLRRGSTSTSMVEKG